MTAEVQHGRDMFRQLWRLYPGACPDDYYRNGAWELETIAIDIELMERHREESGALEPEPLEEIPDVKLPGPAVPPWKTPSSHARSNPPRNGSGDASARSGLPSRSSSANHSRSEAHVPSYSTRASMAASPVGASRSNTLRSPLGRPSVENRPGRLSSPSPRLTAPSVYGNVGPQRRMDEVRSVSSRPRPSSHNERPRPSSVGIANGSRSQVVSIKRPRAEAEASDQVGWKKTRAEAAAPGDLIKLLLT